MKKYCIKIILSFLLILLVIPLSSCTNNKRVIDRLYGSFKVEQIDSERRAELWNSQETFILYTYNSKDSNSLNILNVINSIVDELKIKIYAFDQLSSNYEIKYPTLTMRSEGKKVLLIEKISALCNKDLLISKIQRKIKISSLIMVDDYADLLNIIKEEEALVLFRSNSCPDCRYMDSLFLDSYKLTLDDNYIYVYNVENYGSSGLSYQDFKDKMGLSKTPSNPLGYQKGVIPTYIFYKNNHVSKEVVFFNDVLQMNEDNTKFKLVSSYYQDNPYIGNTYASKTIYYEKTVKFFKKQVIQLVEEVYD